MIKWVIAIAGILAAQVVFWQHARERLPHMDIVPEVPGESALGALALGDSQSFFRLLGLQIQMAGDTFGRFTSLKKYDYRKLYLWFGLLDTLDARSNFVPTMASYYYAQTPNRQDVRYIVDYLLEHVSRTDAKDKWWWLVQAVYLANHRLEDKDLALEAAKRLEGMRDIPIWAQQLPAFIHEQRGEMEDAYRIITEIQENAENLSEGELRFMQYFIEERLNRLEKLHERNSKTP